MAVVEELIARLGFKINSQSDAQKFLRQLEKIKKATKEAGKGMQINFGGNTSGIRRMSADIEHATKALQRFKREATRPLRVNGFGGGFGVGPGGGFIPLPHRGAGRGRTGHGGTGHGASKIGAGEVAQREFVAGLGAGAVASRGTGAAGALLGGIAVASATKSSMSLERQMIEVEKATDATPERSKEIQEYVLKLARKTGKKKEDLAGMYASAGFAGRPAEELDRFTEYAAKATVAWSTTAEETGQALAEIGNIYGANQNRIEQIGDAINTAADKSASREPELLEFLRRTGASGKLAGLSAEQMLGIGAAQKEVGVRTDVASTATEALLNVMRLGEEFSKSAEEGLKQIGYKSNDLRKAFIMDPMGTITKFLDKIAAIKDPMKRAEAMVNTFGKEYQDDIEKLVNARGRMKELIAITTDPAQSQGSVRSQFDAKQGKDTFKVDQAAQSLDVVQVRIGEYFKKLLGAASDILVGAVNGLEGESISPQQREAMVNKLNGLLGLPPGVKQVPTISAGEFDARFKGDGSNKSPFGSLTDRMKWGGAGKMPGAPFFGSLTDRLNWAKTGTQQVTGTSQHTINNTNTGNDQRTQSVTVNQTVNGVAGVASAAAEGAKSGLASMGASVAKANSTPTAGSTAP